MSDDRKSSLPAEAPLPDWISSDLLQEMKSAWRAEYREDLTTAETVGLLQTLAGVFEILVGE
jgi:hypothetical protein